MERLGTFVTIIIIKMVLFYLFISVTIYKDKSDKSICGNSRGIALLSTAGTILTTLMLKRLVRKVSEDLLPETQCGFRSNRSTVDMVFVIRQLF